MKTIICILTAIARIIYYKTVLYKRYKNSTIKTSFIVLTWNRSTFLEICLEKLTDSLKESQNYEIIIYDNGSTDATSSVLSKYENNSKIQIIYGTKNKGLNSYKTLFEKASGENIVIIDDDVLDFPLKTDKIFKDYLKEFPNVGVFALNVIQNEYTDGAKPHISQYEEYSQNGKTIEYGPTGGWALAIRREHYIKIKFHFDRKHLSFKAGEDSRLTSLTRRKLRLRHAIIKDFYCFHACGPFYSKQYGYLLRDIEKYEISRIAQKRYTDLLK